MNLSRAIEIAVSAHKGATDKGGAPHAGIVFKEVNESYTTQACSCCGCISSSSPKGRAGLRIRDWTCSECGVTHDRDINAAKNILAVGHGRPVEGIPVL